MSVAGSDIARLGPSPAEPPGFGDLLPTVRVAPPGPRSRALAAALRQVESPAISTLANGDLPIFWEAACGANVLDADGNVYIDTTSAFGVASVGHRNPAVVAAVQAQSQRLIHGMGDYLPPTARLELALALREDLPKGLQRVIFGLSGADAVEIAVKCATIFSGRPGVITFGGGFHGQSYGTLPLAARGSFGGPFAAQLGRHAARAPFPNPYRRASGLSEEDDIARCIEGVRSAAEELADRGLPAGSLLVEPFQGREGEIFPPDGFLPALRALCDELGLLLIFDEIYTGFGRTGLMWACDHTGVTPDLLCAGKAIGGGLPFSLVAGRDAVMDAWRPSGPEAPHSSTFLGYPLGCAAALAVLRELREHDLPKRGAALGKMLVSALRERTRNLPHVGEVRGRGMMIGVELVRDRTSKEPFGEAMPHVLAEGFRRGLVLLPAGEQGNILSLAPPLTISEQQLEFIVEELPRCLSV